MGTYITSDEVAYFYSSVARRAGVPPTFSSTTSPTETEVDFWITITEAEVESALGQMGYMFPLSNTGGSALDSRQAAFLKMLVGLGVAGYLVERDRPHPAGPNLANITFSNPFKTKYDSLLKQIKDPYAMGVGLRMNTYAGTWADNQFSVPLGPMNDFLDARHDVREYMTLYGMTNVTEAINERELRYRGFWGGLIDWLGVNNGDSTL